MPPPLTTADIPRPDADWSEIIAFARRFDAYAVHGSFDACADIANSRRHDTLEDLRTCLFFEHRRYRHFGHDPEGDAAEYVRDLVRQIRARVAQP